MIVKRRAAVLFLALAAIAVVTIACGVDQGAGAVAGSGDPTSSASVESLLPAATEGGDVSSESANGAPGVGAGDGLDTTCVELVLGRSVTGFGAITDAERTRIFAECSAGGRGGGIAGGGARGFGGVGFDPECIATALGSETTDFTQMTPEQRTAVFEACGGPDHWWWPLRPGRRR